MFVHLFWNIGPISLRDFWLVEKLFGMFSMDSSLVSGLPDHFLSNNATDFL